MTDDRTRTELEPSRIYLTEIFNKNRILAAIFFAKSSLTDVWLSFKYAYA